MQSEKIGGPQSLGSWAIGPFAVTSHVVTLAGVSPAATRQVITFAVSSQVITLAVTQCMERCSDSVFQSFSVQSIRLQFSNHYLTVTILFLLFYCALLLGYIRNEGACVTTH